MPPNFEFPENQKLYTPLAPFAHDTAAGERELFTFARLKDGVTIDRARDELTDGRRARLAREYPVDNEGWSDHSSGRFERSSSRTTSSSSSGR